MGPVRKEVESNSVLDPTIETHSRGFSSERKAFKRSGENGFVFSRGVANYHYYHHYYIVLSLLHLSKYIFNGLRSLQTVYPTAGHKNREKVLGAITKSNNGF